ncbi:MAG: DUF1893 domain-containing protein [Oscillospiraceae bacterium]|jgi:hypothetical protein|nr:DUF1893 domain-containing protein [Oscillospiraceae bacterium]
MDAATYKAVNRARVALTRGEKTFVIVGENKLLYHSDKRGLRPLLELIDSDPSRLEGSIVGDRIVGRAAALLLIRGRVKAVFAQLIADEAIDLLQRHGVLPTWQETIPYVVERDMTSRYKLDLYLKEVEDPQRAVAMIREYQEGGGGPESSE